jgi:hypothetical protein
LVLVLQWLAHRHTAVERSTESQDDSPSAKSTATATKFSATQRKPEEVVDDVTDTIRTTVEGGNTPPPPPLADIELIVGVIRTFCW